MQKGLHKARDDKPDSSGVGPMSGGGKGESTLKFRNQVNFGGGMPLSCCPGGRCSVCEKGMIFPLAASTLGPEPEPVHKTALMQEIETRLLRAQGMAGGKAARMSEELLAAGRTQGRRPVRRVATSLNQQNHYQPNISEHMYSYRKSGVLRANTAVSISVQLLTLFIDSSELFPEGGGLLNHGDVLEILAQTITLGGQGRNRDCSIELDMKSCCQNLRKDLTSGERVENVKTDVEAQRRWEIKKHNPKESLRAGRGERMAQRAQEEEQMYMRVMAELDAEDDAPDDGEIEIDDSEVYGE
ncbi:hypothetical protein B0H14DRAFT_2578585 [Mycena olivaceomarginata]|nr:hypothetical protein B0H14DRAFT_2578585 [Mycena olivaceomarginata]